MISKTIVKQKIIVKKPKKLSASGYRSKEVSTFDEYISSMSVRRKKEFDEGLKNFALSELILALMDKDEVSVRKLAEIACVSPTVVQAMRSGKNKDFTLQSFLKILDGLGCKQFIVEHHGQFIPLDIPSSIKK